MPATNVTACGRACMLWTTEVPFVLGFGRFGNGGMILMSLGGEVNTPLLRMPPNVGPFERTLPSASPL